MDFFRGGAMITLIFVIAIVVAVAAFSAQNATPVAVTFLIWHFEASLALVIVLSLLSGMVIGMALLSMLRLRRSVRGRRKSAGAENAAPGKSDRL
jgi:uncharacterized integral membrane protein